MWFNIPTDKAVKRRSNIFFRTLRYENIDINILFSLKKDNRTRGHEVILVKDQCRLDIRLSTYCVTASSVNMFKNKFDTYLRRADYT